MLKRNISLLIFSLLFLFFPSFAFAKDYSIPKVDIEVNLFSDGSALVKETRTYSFDGSFSWADEWINLSARCKGCRNYEISDFSLEENGVFYVDKDISSAGFYQTEKDEEVFYVKWFYNASNEQKTFTLKYKIKNAITNRADISEFYWQLIGDKWTKSTGEVKATVFLPFAVADDKIWAFGHGPLNGKIDIISNRQINFYASSLPANTFFEVRVLFPKLENAPFAQESNLSLDDVLREEKSFSYKDKAKVWGGLLIALVILAFVLWRLVHWFLLWYKYGKDPKVERVNLSGKLHEPPSDLHPIYVQALVQKGRIDSKAVISTIIDLVRRKALAFRKEKVKSFLGGYKDKFSLVLLDKSKAVNKYEKDLIGLFFDSKDELSFDEIKKIGIRKTRETTSFWQNLMKAKDDLMTLGFLDQKASELKKKLSVELILFAFVVILSVSILPSLSLFTFQLGGVFLILILPFLFIIFASLLIIYGVMDKRTEKGNQELAGWLAFRQFLKDYSVTKSYPIDSVVIWEKYLVYGTVLGISIKALSQLPINYSKDFERSPVFVGLSGGNGPNDVSNFSAYFSEFGKALSSISNSVTSGALCVSSSGGFSGGGGGGGWWRRWRCRLGCMFRRNYSWFGAGESIKISK
ncbi:MAG: hypothetical protein KatS3mg088_183 [Patescibacteria group bacterium]|nr:MAG: hypothetical protein KatS3mg088_183 [Patescibacteria group bacterium]